MTNDEYFNNDAFCPLPWISLYVEPTGIVDNCCISYNRIGNINQQSIEEIINSPTSYQVKTDMLSRKRVDGCRKCYTNEGSSNLNFSHRSNMLGNFQNVDKSLYDSPANFKFKYADIRLRNTCNLACVYCGPELSSMWATELKQFPRVDNSHIESMVDYFCKNAAELEDVYLAGGEPLLIKENETMLTELYRVNPDCRITVNSNLSTIENNRIFDLLLKFKNCRWVISAEDSEERYNYIRYPGNWNLFISNLKKLQSIVGTDCITFNLVYFALNAKTIFNFIELLIGMGFSKSAMHLQYINGGHDSDLDPRYLPKQYLEETNELITSYANSGIDSFDAGIEFILNCLKTDSGRNVHYNTFDVLAKFDQRRNLNSKDVFPDIYAYCN